MRVGNVVALIMVMSVVGNPLDWVALHTKNAPECEDVLKPLVCFETLVSKLSVVRHCDAEAVEKIAECEQLQHVGAVSEWGE